MANVCNLWCFIIKFNNVRQVYHATVLVVKVVNNMDIVTLSKAITSLGLPTALVLVIVLGGIWFLKKYIPAQFEKDKKEREEQTKRNAEYFSFLTDRIEKSDKRAEESESRQVKLIDIGKELSEANKILSEKLTGELTSIKENMGDMEGKLDIITIKLDNKK